VETVPANQEQVNNNLPQLNKKITVLEFVVDVDQSELEIG
jgi:hypothetical protein